MTVSRRPRGPLWEPKPLLTALLAELEMTVEEYLDEHGQGDLVPGICWICRSTADVEPDARRGWCERCQTDAVVSGHTLLLALP